MGSQLAALLLVTAVAGNAVALRVRAQSPASEPRFEVASIKPNNRNDGQVSVSYRNGRYTATGVSLELLIRTAYQVQEFQIVDAPDWSTSDRFDIMAVAADPNAPQQPMLRALLQVRFNLVLRREMRERPVYALVIARADGRLGPQLRPSALNCATRGSEPRCGTSVGPGRIQAGGRSMAELATALSNLTNTGSSLGRLIVDRTGLAGAYDADLRFTPDNAPTPGLQPGSPAIDSDGPSIFTALQEQLGLKLEPARAPVDVLVVQRVERPTPD